MLRVLTGDVRQVLPTLERESVHCVVTSPPYYGLRDYGTAQWAGGNAECDHLRAPGGTGGDPRYGPNKGNAAGAPTPMGRACIYCHATRVDNQLGLESTPAAYIASMVEVFREVRRVLRKDGTLWLNIGDSYAGSGKGYGGGSFSETSGHAAKMGGGDRQSGINSGMVPVGMKAKDLIGIPWMLAFALRDDGWYLRSDIIWSKPNPMPESVTDRPTKAHEYVFLLTKSARYYYDADAIREANSDWSIAALQSTWERKTRNSPLERNDGNGNGNDSVGSNYADKVNPAGRNKRSVWEIATEPYPEAHFATYPTALVEPCIKAGTSEKGCCPECGAPWIRVVETERWNLREERRGTARGWVPNGRTTEMGQQRLNNANGQTSGTDRTTTGWRPTCAHGRDPVPCTVLDPFAGAGTTLLVADRLNRHAIGIELSPTYASLATRRLTDDCPLFTQLALDAPG